MTNVFQKLFDLDCGGERDIIKMDVGWGFDNHKRKKTKLEISVMDQFTKFQTHRNKHHSPNLKPILT